MSGWQLQVQQWREKEKFLEKKNEILKKKKLDLK